MKENVIQKAEKQPKQQGPNLTGIPTQMKIDFERRSGLSFDDVRVHYNSDKPTRIGALAYTQGTQVYMAPGQERHLGHELGHVIQQKSFRVPPTSWINGQPVNDSPALECQADILGSFPCAISHSEDGRRKQYPIQKLSIYVSVDDEINVPAPDTSAFNDAVEYLYFRVIVPFFNENGYQFFRIRHYFRIFMTELAEAWPEGQLGSKELIEMFISHIDNQTMRVGRNEIKVLRKFNASSMGRPSWTKEIKRQLSERKREDAGERTDIRHVVRNYHLKTAIKTAIENSSLPEVARAARRLLNEDNPEDATMIRRLYTVLYRNIDNLWMGNSAMNQLIGFLANVFENYGTELISVEIPEGEEQNFLTVFLARLSSSVWAQSNIILKKFPKQLECIQSQVNEYLKLVNSYADDAIQNGLSLYNIGYFLIEIGDTLGFDMIDDLSPDSHMRTARLIRVASSLIEYTSGVLNMDVGDLMDNFALFLGSESQKSSDSDGSEQAHAITQAAEGNKMDDGVLDSGSQESNFELFQINNCLITAIAAYIGASPGIGEITQIRMSLWANLAVPPGVFLNADDANVVAGIFMEMGIQNAVLVVHDMAADMYNVVIPAFGAYEADTETDAIAIIQRHYQAAPPTIISITLQGNHFYSVST